MKVIKAHQNSLFETGIVTLQPALSNNPAHPGNWELFRLEQTLLKVAAECSRGVVYCLAVPLTDDQWVLRWVIVVGGVGLLVHCNSQYRIPVFIDRYFESGVYSGFIQSQGVDKIALALGTSTEKVIPWPVFTAGDTKLWSELKGKGSPVLLEWNANAMERSLAR